MKITVILQTTGLLQTLPASACAGGERALQIRGCILSSHNFCCVLLSTARIIRLKHDSIGKLNLNFVFKVSLIMQN